MKKRLLFLLIVLAVAVPHLHAQNKNFTAVAHSLRDTVETVKSYVPPVRQWLSLRGNAEVRFSGAEEGLTVNYFAVLAKDSLLYLHVSKFGIEFARACCTPDSLTVLLHTSQSYWQGAYSLFYGTLGIPLNFKMLQDLLLLSQELPGKQVDSAGFPTQAVWKAGDTATLFTVDYARYENAGQDSLAVYYPQEMRLRVPEAEVEVRLQHRAVKVDVPGPSSLKIPEKYTRTKLFIK